MALYPCVLGRLRNGDFSRCKWRTSCRVCLLLWDANVPWYLVAITCASKQISCVLCRRRDSPYISCAWRSPNVDFFFLPGVAVLRFRVCSLLWHAWLSTTVLSDTQLCSQNKFYVFCVAGVIVHIYLCAWRSPNVDFFLPGVCSLLWHACVLLKHNSLFRSTSHLQNLSSVQQVVCVSCPLCLCICIYSCKSVLYIIYGQVRGRPEMDGKVLAHSGCRRLLLLGYI